MIVGEHVRGASLMEREIGPEGWLKVMCWWQEVRIWELAVPG